MSLDEIAPSRTALPTFLARPVVGGVLIAVLAAGDRAHGAAFWTIAGVAMAYALVAALASARGRLPGHPLAAATVDAAILLAAAEATGGVTSPAALALSVIPLSLALRLRASDVAIATALLLLVSGVLWGLRVAGPDDDGSRWLIVAVLLSWTGLAAAFIAGEYQARTARISELADASQRLTRQLLAAEQHERERVADDLHDDVLQFLLAASQDMQEVVEGDADAVLRAGAGVEIAARQLRATVTQLRGDRLRSGGLDVALTTLANHAAARRGYDVTVDVDVTVPDTYHLLVLALVRDLLLEADRRPGRRTVAIAVRRHGERLEVAVDDAVSPGALRAAEPPAAVAERLGWSAERVRAVGGTFHVRALPDGGIGVVAGVPLAAAVPDSGIDLLPTADRPGHPLPAFDRTYPT
jgi:signal transduction histidine kinase